jgi:NADPH-dependent 2,4-dienoyl-CoA reductase/sulfur reductase-like enzyme
MNRRHFLQFAGLASASLTLPRVLRGATTAPRVVVVGGGFAGATVAKYLRLWGANLDVTLIDRDAEHHACILSNLVVTGQLPISRIRLGYGALQTQRGVKVVQAEVVEVNPAERCVVVQDAAGYRAYPYDRLVLAPGIDFITPAGAYDPLLTPHAWKAGPQTLLLKQQLAALPSRGTFVMNIPKSPYRCPPGPYERACVVADYLKRKKPGSRIVVLDANSTIQAEPLTFDRAFNETYRGLLTYVPNAEITAVLSAEKKLVTTRGSFSGAVVNYIPNQRAGEIVTQAGLVNDPSGRWALVDPLTYASTVNPAIHILGDSQGTGQPKSGHMANSQAKVCADAIIRAFAGEAPDPAPTTSSACFSPITSTKASWLSASFQYDAATGAMKRVDLGEAHEPTSDGFQQMYQWADNIFADSFA